MYLSTLLSIDGIIHVCEIKNIPLGKNAQGHVAGSDKASFGGLNPATAIFAFHSWILSIYLNKFHGIFVSGDFRGPAGPLTQEIRKANG
jgi:hypothetical protein